MSARRAFSVAVYAVHGGAVLLVHHKRLDAWLPVGGEVEPGETPLEAARRELQEETGLEGAFDLRGPAHVDGTPPGFLAYEEHPAGAKGLHMNFNFAARVPTRDVRGDGSFVAHRWVAARDLDATAAPTNVIEGARLALAAAGSRPPKRAASP